MKEFDLLKMSVEAAAPNNTVIYDDLGNPSVMVRIPKFRICDVIEGGSDQVHPAFIVNGKEIPEFYVSKFSNVLINERACSIPGVSPQSEVPREQVKAACESKGKGWHMMTNAEWAAIALWCKKNGYMPSGNNSFAKDYYRPYERGTVTYSYERNGEIREGKTAVGSGPVSWNHDHSPAGIADMNGNVWTQVGGLRLVEGEIQIIADNDSAAGVDESDESALWKAILPDGTLTAPGTPGTLKYDQCEGKIVVSDQVKGAVDKWASAPFGGIGAQTRVPELLKALALFPADPEGYGEQGVWCNNTGIRFPWRGGTWDAFQYSGLYCLFMCYPRPHISEWMGFRAAYIAMD